MNLEGGYVIAGRLLTAYYFLHFLVILPLLGIFETPRKLPASIADSVLLRGGSGAFAASGAAAAPSTKG